MLDSLECPVLLSLQSSEGLQCRHWCYRDQQQAPKDESRSLAGRRAEPGVMWIAICLFLSSGTTTKVQKAWLYHKLCLTWTVSSVSFLVFFWMCLDWVSRACVYTDTCSILLWHLLHYFYLNIYVTVCKMQWGAHLMQLHKMRWYSTDRIVLSTFSLVDWNVFFIVCGHLPALKANPRDFVLVSI